MIRAFKYENGIMTNLGTLDGAYPGSYSIAYGINDSGTVVGDSNGYAFKYENGVMTSLAPLTLARGINNSGTIIGGSILLGENGTITTLGTLGGPSTNAYAVNDFGAVVGYSLSTSSSHAFKYENGIMTDLGTLGGSYSTAYGINNSGSIVGDSTVANDTSRAFVYQNGIMYDLNSLVNINGITLTASYGINDRGQIIANGGDHAYLLTPIAAIPEAATFVSVLCGCLLVWVITILRRRNRCRRASI
jgi:probable HAF family extracellular repeat protein